MTAKKDRINVLRRQLTLARQIMEPYSADKNAKLQAAAFDEATKTYLERLASSGVDITDEHVETLEHELKFLGSASAAGDLDSLLQHGNAILSALPGDPTTGLRPPTIRQIS